MALEHPIMIGPKTGEAYRAKRITGVGSDNIHALCRDSSDNVYVTGRLKTNGNVDGNYFGVQGPHDMFLAKFNAQGEFQWGQRGGGSDQLNMNEDDRGEDVVYDPASDALYVCGAYEGYPATFGEGISFSGKGAFVAKYSTDGDCLWVRRTDKGGAGHIYLNASGNILVTGNSETIPSDSITLFGNQDVRIKTGPFVAAYSTTGELLWAKSIGQELYAWIVSEGDNYLLMGVTVDADPNLIGIGISLEFSISVGFIAEIDTEFDQLNWIRIFDSSTMSYVWDYIRAENGDHIISGIFMDSLHLFSDTLQGPIGEYRPFLLRLDSTGTVEQWVMDLGTNAFRAPRFSMFTDSTIVLATPFVDSVQVGGQTFHAGSEIDFLVARIDTDGNLISAVNNGPITMSNMDVAAMSDGGVVLGSTFSGTIDLGNDHVLTGGADIFVAKFSVITSAPAFKASASGELFIYANPNNGTCTIELPEDLLYEKDLVLRILDTQGRVVQQSNLRMHEDRVQLDIRAQARGTYVAEVGNGKVRYTGRIVFE